LSLRVCSASIAAMSSAIGESMSGLDDAAVRGAEDERSATCVNGRLFDGMT
jgi:hypothetical protein